MIKELTPYIPAVEIFQILLRENQELAFLDSSLVNELGHYSVIGRCPYLKLVKDGAELYYQWKAGRNRNFIEDYMREYLNTHKDKT